MSPLDRKELDMTIVTLHTLTYVCVCIGSFVLLLRITFTW